LGVKSPRRTTKGRVFRGGSGGARTAPSFGSSPIGAERALKCGPKGDLSFKKSLFWFCKFEDYLGHREDGYHRNDDELGCNRLHRRLMVFLHKVRSAMSLTEERWFIIMAVLPVTGGTPSR